MAQRAPLQERQSPELSASKALHICHKTGILTLSCPRSPISLVIPIQGLSSFLGCGQGGLLFSFQHKPDKGQT
eukprot:5036241-Amphidinium_carterae.1